MKCLIVDDEMFCREFVATLLEPVAVCHEAASGEEAIDMYKSALGGGEPFDAVIMDIMMPGLSGHDAATAIQSMAKGSEPATPVKIVMLTGLNSPPFADLESAAYLAKPVSKDGLYSVLL